MSNTNQELISLAAKRFNVNEELLAPEDDFFQKLDINSIQALELLSEVEMKFDIEIPDYELQGVVTFEALAALIDKRR